MKKKKIQWLFLVYAVMCLSPYFIPALNQVNPKILGIPFTIYSINIWMGLCCVLLHWLSNHVWDSYEGGEE